MLGYSRNRADLIENSQRCTSLTPVCERMGECTYKLKMPYSGTYICTKPAPVASRYKIVESIPDKNGAVIIAIKEDPEGQFVSRGAAMEYIHIIESLRRSIPDELVVE